MTGETDLCSEPVRVPTPEERREQRIAEIKRDLEERYERQTQRFLAWRDNGGKAAARRRRQMDRIASRRAPTLAPVR